MEVPFIEQVKIQAQILVPILKEFQEEFGEKKVNQVVERATAPVWRQFGEQWWENTPGTPVEKISKAIDMFAIGDAIDVEELKKTESEYDFDITRCSYAEFYKDLGEPELGSLLVCGVDDPTIPRGALAITVTTMTDYGHGRPGYQLVFLSSSS